MWVLKACSVGVWVSKACRMCECRRLVGCVWVSKACSVDVEGCRVCVSKACRVCGCRRLIVWVWVSKACRCVGVERLVGSVGVKGL